MRLKSIIALFLALPALLCGCSGGDIPAVESGVSQALAEFRSGMLSDVRYSITFSIPESLDERVIGQESISFSLKRRAQLQLDFREGRDAVIGLRVNGVEYPVDYREEHILLPWRALVKGDNTVQVTFVSGDRSLNRNEGYLYTLFVPDRARTVFPCFDQPDLKGRFSLTLEVPASWEAVANSPRLAVNVSGERKTVSFKETPPLSTYLFAFAAGEWQRETRMRKGEPMSVYYRETDPAKTAQIDEIFSQVFQSLDWLEAYTDIPCPFEKYDFVIVPGFQFGGMEHPGAILFNDRRMSLGETPTTSEKLSRIELIAHETSHLWFGDGVTMRWFNDVWTKEVYANYFGAKISTPLYPEVNVPLRDFRNFNIPAYAEDRTAGTNAIRQALPNLSNAGLIYGNIVYDKAPVVMRMLSNLLGDSAFRDGIREYLRTYMYANADWNDLITILDRRTSVDLKDWSRVWVEEKGMPVISYSLDGNGILTVRQDDPLVAGAAASYLSSLSIHGPLAGSELLENLLYEVCSDVSIPGEIRLTAFRSLAEMFRTDGVRQVLWTVFREGKGYKGLQLNVRDYMTLAYELVVRYPERYEDIRTIQEQRIENPDLLREFRFVYRSVSPEKDVRDALFTSLLEAENRSVEPWTASVLSYLNHPLRQQEALAYIRPGLEELPEIQQTGDIFFPKNWCVSLLRGHDSPEAAAEVKSFLQDKPDFPELLKAKLLQSADHLLR